jgi:hypothetical protein
VDPIGRTTGTAFLIGKLDRFQGCFQHSNGLEKIRTDGTSDTKVGLVCRGEWARYLFDAIRPYADQDGPTETDAHEVRIYRFFDGNDIDVPSQCYHTIQNARGQAIDEYRCSLYLDFWDISLRLQSGFT